jgi:hypothetical protein
MLEAERRSRQLKGFAHLKPLKKHMHELIRNPDQTLSSKTTKINSKKVNKIHQAA